MDKDFFNTKYLLNDVLRNINQDIVILRKDFKKLNELVIVLSVKIDETKSIKSEMASLFSKIDSMTIKMFDLEKAKDRLEALIKEIDHTNKTSDVIANLSHDQKNKLLNDKISELTTKIPILKKIIAVLFALIGILVYVTESTSKFIEVCVSLIKKLFFL